MNVRVPLWTPASSVDADGIALDMVLRRAKREKGSMVLCEFSLVLVCFYMVNDKLYAFLCLISEHVSFFRSFFECFLD